MIDKQRLGQCDGCQAENVGGTQEITVDVARGPWVIEFQDSSKNSHQRFLRRGERLTIGSRREADIVVDDSWISGCHCALDASAQGLELIDLDSKNGVYLGNAKISRARLELETATFTIGKTSFFVKENVQREARGRVEPIRGLVGQSEPMVRLVADIRRLAALRAPVLIVGESGVGKDVVARALHELSGRSGPLVPLNVATIPESLADSELFGHCRGAFTGAIQQRIGAFEQAHQGTLFLDEIGELVPTVQAKMLRVLEDGMVRQVGATQARRVDVRVVSATCAPLGERCASGQFRFDLLQRLSVVTVAVPALRERRSDIPLLAQAWLERFKDEVGARCISQDGITRLGGYEWPGNVRQLGAVLYRACISCDQSLIDGATIERALSSQVGAIAKRRADPREFMTLAEGNVSQAARLAGLPRTTFRTWLSRVKKEGIVRAPSEG